MCMCVCGDNLDHWLDDPVRPAHQEPRASPVWVRGGVLSDTICPEFVGWSLSPLMPELEVQSGLLYPLPSRHLGENQRS